MARRSARNLTRIAHRLSVALVLAAVATVVFVSVRWLYREQRYNHLIEQIALEQGADKFLIKAVMRQESGFDPFAYSSAKAIGLMQVTEAAGRDWARATGQKEFTREWLWNERVNIQAGAWYLGRALEYWRGQGVTDPLPFALAEYNAGRGNVQRWLAGRPLPAAEDFREWIPSPGVRHYITKVTGYRQDYEARGHL